MDIKVEFRENGSKFRVVSGIYPHNFRENTTKFKRPEITFQAAGRKAKFSVNYD